jgi:hypothetical protein
MNERTKRILFWTPRVLAVLFAIFISIFAFDIFDEGYAVWETILALLIHLIPTAVVLLILALAWRWEWIGGILLPILGLLYLITFEGQHWSAYLLIAGPLFLIGALFWLNWLYRSELRSSPGV